MPADLNLRPPAPTRGSRAIYSRVVLGALGRWASRVLGGTGAPALALLLTLGLFLFPAALLGGKVLSPGDSVLFAPGFAPERPATLTHPSNPALNDVTVLFEDHLAQARHAIRQGHLPLWNPQVGAGRPLGGAQGAPLFPTSWLAYVLPFWTSLAWIALAKLLLAGAGMALFCRAVGLGRAAALLGGVAFAFSTLYVTYLGHGHTADFGLAPWALFAAERLAAGGGARSTLGLGLAVGLALYSGHPETSLLVILLAYAYLTFRLDERRRAGESLRVLRKPVALGLASGVLGIFIGALALTALLDVTGESLRLSRSGSLHVSLRDLFVGATLPELWGRPDKTVFRAGTFQVFSSFFHGRVYLGVVPLLLGAIGFVRRPAPRQVFFAAVAVVSLLAALGRVAHSILRHLPGLALVGSFQYLWPLTVAGAVLAAYGAQRALDPDPLTRRRAPIVGGVLVTAAVIAALGARPHLLEQLASGVKDIPTLRHGEASADAAAAGSLMRFFLLAGGRVGVGGLGPHGAGGGWGPLR